MDAVIGKDAWDVSLIESDGKIIAALPYFLKKKMGFSIITMPRFMSHMGVWMKHPHNQNPTEKIHQQQKLTEDLIDQLPAFDDFTQSFPVEFDNWMGFYWRGYEQTTRYTYQLKDLDNPDLRQQYFAHSKRKNIKRAEGQVEIKDDLTPELLYEHHKASLNKEGKKIEYSLAQLKDMVGQAYLHNAGKIIYAEDEQGNIHAILFSIWNQRSSYNIIQSVAPEFRNSGASSLLVQEMIDFLKDKTEVYDFEGSMDKNIAESFRRFGAQPVPYFVVKKTNSKVLKW